MPLFQNGSTLLNKMVVRAKNRKKKKKTTLKDRISRWTKWLLKNIWTFFLLMAFWKFQHFNLVSKMPQKLFKPLPYHKFQYLTVLEKCCMPSAYLQWRFHSGERVVARGPLVLAVLFVRRWFHIWRLFVLICPSSLLYLVPQEGGLCFMIVAFPGYRHIFLPT